MGSRRTGTLTATDTHGTEYTAGIYAKSCPCSPGLKCIPISTELVFVRGLLPAEAQELIQQRGWTSVVRYEK